MESVKNVQRIVSIAQAICCAGIVNLGFGDLYVSIVAVCVAELVPPTKKDACVSPDIISQKPVKEVSSVKNAQQGAGRVNQLMALLYVVCVCMGFIMTATRVKSVPRLVNKVHVTREMDHAPMSVLQVGLGQNVINNATLIACSAIRLILLVVCLVKQTILVKLVTVSVVVIVNEL